MKNISIRRLAAANGVRLWQIAERLGVSDASFSRKLRREFSTEERERVIAIINEIAQEANDAE